MTKKFKTITSKTIFKHENKETVPATFSEPALEQLRAFYTQGLENGLHSLKEDEFIGWMAAVGVMSLTKGEMQLKEEEE